MSKYETFETFSDESFYGMWAVRPVGEKRWGYCYHVPSKDEAEGLAKELDELAALRVRAQGLEKAIQDMLHAVSDLGIHPKSIVEGGVETHRTERQSGWNDCVMQLGAALDIIAGRLNVEENEIREDHWCWSEPLKELEHDKARYSYLKAHPQLFHPAFVVYGNSWKSPEEIDAAIDAAKENTK